MNQRRLVNAASLLLILVCFTPAIAQNQPSSPGSARTQDSQKVDEAKEKERKDEEARLEAEKRKQIEDKKHRKAEEAARQKEENARKDEERKAQERKAQERKEEVQKQEEEKRKEEDRKREEDKRKTEERKIEEDKRKDEDRKREQDKRKTEERKIEEDKRKEQDRKSEEQRRKEEEIRLEVEKRKRLEREQERDRERERYSRIHPREDRDYGPGSQSAPPETIIIVAPQAVDNGPATPAASTATTTASPANTAVPPVTPPVPVAPTSAAAQPAPTAQLTPAAQPTATAPQVAAIPVSSRRYYREPETYGSYVSLLCAPGQGDRKTAIGLQYLTRKNYGVGLWFSGSFGRDSDVIQGTIPHSDFYTESTTGTIGVEALCCVGSDAAMLVFGAGISVDQTQYTDVSNATGWKWDGGESTTTRPAAQIGCRFRVGGRISLQLGYDTAQSAFFGLSAGF